MLVLLFDFVENAVLIVPDFEEAGLHGPALGEDRPRKFYVITAEGRAMKTDLLEVWDNQNRILGEIKKENIDVQ